MTVAELIEALQAFDQRSRVVVDVSEDVGLCDVVDTGVMQDDDDNANDVVVLHYNTA